MPAQVTRHIIGKMGMLIVTLYSAHYYFKYNAGVSSKIVLQQICILRFFNYKFNFS